MESRLRLSRLAAAFCLAVITLLMPYAARAADKVGPDDYTDISNTSLLRAVELLEKAEGTKVLEVRIAYEDGHHVFKAVTVTANDGAIHYMRVDPIDETIIAILEVEMPVWMTDWKLRQEAKSIDQAKVQLHQAIATAQALTAAPAVAAGIAKPLTPTNRVLAYNVELMKKNRPERVVIDATTGKKIANPESLYYPWTPLKLIEGAAKL